MTQNGPAGNSAAEYWTLHRPPNVKFTTHALHTLDVRGITEAEVGRALSEGSVRLAMDEKTGNSVITTSRFIVVGKQNDGEFLVRAVLNSDEIHA